MQSFFASESLAYCSRPESSFAELHIHAIRRIQATSRAQIGRVASRLFLVSYDTIACSISLKNQTQNRIAKRENKN